MAMLPSPRRDLESSGIYDRNGVTWPKTELLRHGISGSPLSRCRLYFSLMLEWLIIKQRNVGVRGSSTSLALIILTKQHGYFTPHLRAPSTCNRLFASPTMILSLPQVDQYLCSLYHSWGPTDPEDTLLLPSRKDSGVNESFYVR